MRQTTPPSRRTFITATSLAVAAAWLGPRRILAQESGGDGPVQTIRKAGAAGKVTVEAMRGNVSMLSGSGGNIAVLNGPDGKLLVDAGVGKSPVLAALDTIGKEPIRYLVNTHWHFDHTDGNEWLRGAGATIVAHENTRKRMSTKTRVEAWDFTFAPAPPAALPTVTVRDELTLHVNGTAVALKYYGPCHTDTDVRVTFPEADVVHVGDTWWNGHYPFIDYSTGGSIDGSIRAAETNLDAVGDKTLVIPGHGPAGGRRELTEFRDVLRAARDAVAALKKQGRSADEAVAAKPTAKYDAKWGTFVISPEVFTRLVYAGV